MKKRITYEIIGQVERNCFFRVGKAMLRVEFTGGAVNSSGIYPALYVTDNPLYQSVIEASDDFKRGVIRRGNVEEIAQETEVKDEEGEDNVYPEVTTLQQARQLLIAEPYCCPMASLQNKVAVKEAAKEKNVKFPNWI